MERVFAKYNNVKDVFEDLLGKTDGKLRKLFSEGIIHIFDAENPGDEDDFIAHGLNIGIYGNSSNVKHNSYGNVVLINNQLEKSLIESQILFFTCSNGAMIDAAFSMNKENYNEFKRNLEDLRKIEIVLNKVHDHYVPLRKHNYKNLKVYSKYLVGESVGGDYFDVDEVNKKVYLTMASFDSYVSSVNFMKNIESLKSANSSSFQKVSDFIDENRKGITSIVFMEIDTLRLSIKYLYHGDMFLDHPEIKLGKGEVFLKQGDTIQVGSFGFKKLTKDYKKELVDSSVDAAKISNNYNNYFSFLNNKKRGRFLSEDATLITIKINDNVIKEV